MYDKLEIALCWLLTILIFACLFSCETVQMTDEQIIEMATKVADADKFLHARIDSLAKQMDVLTYNLHQVEADLSYLLDRLTAIEGQYTDDMSGLKRLSWDAVEDAISYKVYIGEKTGRYDQVFVIDSLSYDLPARYVSVTTVDSLGLESEYSQEIVWSP